MTQPDLFTPKLEDLRRITKECPTCHRKWPRQYCKTLDRRLVSQAYEILDYLWATKRRTFNPRVVFNEDHHKILDSNKLHYWHIIEKADKSGYWRLTPTGYAFLLEGRKLPKKLWVLENHVVQRSEETVNVNQIEPRWQMERSDYAFDFIPQT